MVLTLSGWEQNRGVEAEIAAARENGVPAEFLNLDVMILCDDIIAKRRSWPSFPLPPANL